MNFCNRSLSESAQEMKEVKLYNILDSVDEKYHTVVKSIMKSCKYKNKKSNRYSDEWILMCRLFHIKSPAGYNFLRNNNILPLPCIQTKKIFIND